LAGELSNAAHYFSTFANVNKADCTDYKKEISFEGCNWKPFKYSKRITDAQKAQKKMQELETTSKASKQTKRTHLTAFIGNTLKSRQEFVPLVLNYVDRAKAEPLHLKNNVVKETFLKLLKLACTQSTHRPKAFKDLHENDFLSTFVEFVRSSMNCNFLCTKLIQWYNESGGKLEGDFSFRFRGYLKHFPDLIQMMLVNLKNRNVAGRFHEVFYQSVHLRKIISYSVRIENFNQTILEDMKKECAYLFKACCRLDSKVSPSLWTLCNAAPFHAEITYKDYTLGLGVNTMEGREQKHQAIKRYADIILHTKIDGE